MVIINYAGPFVSWVSSLGYTYMKCGYGRVCSDKASLDKCISDMRQTRLYRIATVGSVFMEHLLAATLYYYKVQTSFWTLFWWSVAPAMSDVVKKAIDVPGTRKIIGSWFTAKQLQGRRTSPSNSNLIGDSIGDSTTTASQYASLVEASNKRTTIVAGLFYQTGALFDRRESSAQWMRDQFYRTEAMFKTQYEEYHANVLDSVAGSSTILEVIQVVLPIDTDILDDGEL